MYLAPDGDEVDIANAAGGFLTEAMSIDRLHASAGADMSAALRRQIGDMGWFALALPESAGGSGLSSVEHALFFREVGRHCGPIDVLTQCLAAMVVDDADLRARIVSGETAVALAVRDGSHMRLLGSHEATHAIEVGQDYASLTSLAGIDIEPRPSLDPAMSMRLTPVFAAPAGSDQSHIWRMGALGTAAMLVGIAEASLDQIVEYAKVRETFGKKIGSWQAVRHPCADMAVRLESARSQLWFAAAAMKEGRSDAAVHLDAAKLLANQAAMANADSNIQLHGGIGVTDEHNAHLFLKHALVLSKLFGAKRSLLGRLLHACVED